MWGSHCGSTGRNWTKELFLYSVSLLPSSHSASPPSNLRGENKGKNSLTLCPPPLLLSVTRETAAILPCPFGLPWYTSQDGHKCGMTVGKGSGGGGSSSSSSERRSRAEVKMYWRWDKDAASLLFKPHTVWLTVRVAAMFFLYYHKLSVNMYHTCPDPIIKPISPSRTLCCRSFSGSNFDLHPENFYQKLIFEGEWETLKCKCACRQFREDCVTIHSRSNWLTAAKH